MKLLLYCTKAKPYITIAKDKTKTYPSCVISDGIQEWHLNGKIVAECDFEVEKHNETTNDWLCMSLREKIVFGNLCEEANIDELKCYEYANGKPLYAIHIKNLHIFDKPRELEQLETCDYKTIKKTPQNMMKCIVLKNDEHYDEYILISIRPEWMCKILNGEKTIEVRKRVLKEMLK